MSKLICPFCQKELHKDSDGYYTCYTDNCGCMKCGGNGASGSESLWLTLIRTRKALDVAVKALERLDRELYFNNAKQACHIADSVAQIPGVALDQIKQTTETKE